MTQPTVHLICNAHLDPVWQWRWEEGCAEALSTFRTAVDLLREYPQLIFNHNEAILYQWVESHDPRLFADIQQLVAEKRWVIAGGWLLQPDCNLPGIEALLRQIDEGRHYFYDRFGVTPRVAYNFDSFGHTGGLPQVLRQAGYELYIHMRPQPHELQLPADLYRWRGLDGTEIPAVRIAIGLYHTEPDNIEQRLLQGVELALRLRRDVPVFWGLGDHGGGATREDIHKIEAFIAREGRVNIVHSSTEFFYQSVKDAIDAAPVVEGDIQRVFTGCYTSMSRIKRRAVANLGLLMQTETLRTATQQLYQQAFPAHELHEAWLSHLFNDFHDILPGTCIEPAEQDALDQYGHSALIARRLRMGAASAFNGEQRHGYPLPVTVLNANPACTRVPIEVECMLEHRPRLTGNWRLRLYRPDGQEIPCQEGQPESLLPFNGWRRKVTFFDELPGVGASRYHLEVCAGDSVSSSTPAALTHRFNACGLIDSLETSSQIECLRGHLLEPIVIDDDGDAWGAERWQYRTEAGRFESISHGARIIESGPVRTVTETVMAYRSSRIVYHTIAYPDWPVLDIRMRVTWNEQRKRLKLSLPTLMQGPTVYCEVPGGAIRRPADGDEHVHSRWMLLDGHNAQQDIGMLIVTNGAHGFDCHHGEVRLSVLRSAAYCHEQGFSLGDQARKYMDIGVHELRVLVSVGRQTDMFAMAPGLADWVSTPPMAIAHLPLGFSQATNGVTNFASLHPSTVRMLACKPAREGKGVIVRVQESIGQATEMQLRLIGASCHVHLAPFEIKTLCVEPNGGFTEVDPIDEMEVSQYA